jgi:hypothetical protein
MNNISSTISTIWREPRPNSCSPGLATHVRPQWLCHKPSLKIFSLRSRFYYTHPHHPANNLRVLNLHESPDCRCTNGAKSTQKQSAVLQNLHLKKNERRE